MGSVMASMKSSVRAKLYAGILEQIQNLIPHQRFCTVLIYGETGTGKGTDCAHMHNLRRGDPAIRLTPHLNCAPDHSRLSLTGPAHGNPMKMSWGISGLRRPRRGPHLRIQHCSWPEWQEIENSMEVEAVEIV